MLVKTFPGDFWASGYINPNGISSIQIKEMECWHAVLTGLLGTTPPDDVVATSDGKTIAELLREDDGLSNTNTHRLVTK